MGTPAKFFSATRIKIPKSLQVKSLPIVRYRPPFSPYPGHSITRNTRHVNAKAHLIRPRRLLLPIMPLVPEYGKIRTEFPDAEMFQRGNSPLDGYNGDWRSEKNLPDHGSLIKLN